MFAHLFASSPHRHQVHEPSTQFGSWFAITLLVSIISIILIWLLLLVGYQPACAPDGDREIKIQVIRPTRESFTLKQYWVGMVCLVKIKLWCIKHKIEDMIGDTGIIAIIPIIAFFVTGALKKVQRVRGAVLSSADAFRRSTLSSSMIVFLAMDGITLGNAVKSSGLMDTMDGIIHHMLKGRTLYSIAVVLLVMVLICPPFLFRHLLSLTPFVCHHFHRLFRHSSATQLLASLFPSHNKWGETPLAVMPTCSFSLLV